MEDRFLISTLFILFVISIFAAAMFQSLFLLKLVAPVLVFMYGIALCL